MWAYVRLIMKTSDNKSDCVCVQCFKKRQIMSMAIQTFPDETNSWPSELNKGCNCIAPPHNGMDYRLFTPSRKSRLLAISFQKIFESSIYGPSNEFLCKWLAKYLILMEKGFQQITIVLLWFLSQRLRIKWYNKSCMMEARSELLDLM